MVLIAHNLLGKDLKEVEDKLKAEGAVYNLIKTTPPDKSQGKGRKKVIAIQNRNKDKYNIIWSYEDYR